MAGLHGVEPSVPIDDANPFKGAAKALAPATLTYVQGGGDEFTPDHNAAAFQRLGIVSRVMTGSQAALEAAVFSADKIAAGEVPALTGSGAPGRTRTSTDFSTRF